MDPELKIHLPICNGEVAWWHQLQHVMKASESLKIGCFLWLQIFWCSLNSYFCLGCKKEEE
jgi:hypothetical protein